MKASQYIYTSWKNGDSLDKGFMIYSKSTDITEVECSEIFYAMQYVVPRDLNLMPTPEEIADTFPYSFASFELSTGRHCVAQSTYIGRDYSTRFGNYIVYALIFDKDELSVYPAELFGQDYMKTAMTEEELNAKPPVPPLPKLEIEDYGDVINDDEIVNFISEREDEFAYLLSAVIAAKEKGVPLYLNDTRENLVLWFAAIQKAFPLEIAKKLSFTTYVGNYNKFNDMNARVKFDCYGVRSGEFNFDYRAGVSETNKIVLDFLGGNMTANIPVLVVARAIAESYTIGMDEIYSFARFLEENNYNSFGSDLESAYLAYTLNERDEFDFNDANVISLLGFMKKNQSKDLNTALASKLISIFPFDKSLKIETLTELIPALYENADFMMYSVHQMLLGIIKMYTDEKAESDKVAALLTKLKIDSSAIYKEFVRYLASAEVAAEMSTYFDTAIGNKSGVLLTYQMLLEILLENKRGASDMSRLSAEDILLKKMFADLTRVKDGGKLFAQLAERDLIYSQIFTPAVEEFLAAASSDIVPEFCALISPVLAKFSESYVETFISKNLKTENGRALSLTIDINMIRNAEDPERKFWTIYRSQFEDKGVFASLDMSDLILAFLESNPGVAKAGRILESIPFSHIQKKKAAEVIVGCFLSASFGRIREERIQVLDKVVELAAARGLDCDLSKVNAVCFLNLLNSQRCDLASYIKEHKIDILSFDKKEYKEFLEESLPTFMKNVVTADDFAKLTSMFFTRQYFEEYCEDVVSYLKKLRKDYEGKWLDLNGHILAYLADAERDEAADAFFEEYRKYFCKMDDKDQLSITTNAKQECKNKESERIRLVGEKKRFSFKNLFGKNK